MFRPWSLAGNQRPAVDDPREGWATFEGAHARTWSGGDRVVRVFETETQRVWLVKRRKT